METFPGTNLLTPELHQPLTAEDEAAALGWLNEIITNPPNPIRNVVFVHGWTLSPEDPGWYQKTAAYLERACGVTTTVLAMPDTENPNPIEWQKTLDAAVDCPDTTLVVGHSLGFITALNWAYKKSEENPRFRLAGLASVAGNIDDVGLEEIHHHFDDINVIQERIARVRRHVGRVTLMYGGYDQFVSPEHGATIARLLGRPFQLARDQAHFSGPYTTEDGMTIEACDDLPHVQAFLADMIVASDPKRFPKDATTVILKRDPQTGIWNMPLWLLWSALQGDDDATMLAKMEKMRQRN